MVPSEAAILERKSSTLTSKWLVVTGNASLVQLSFTMWKEREALNYFSYRSHNYVPFF